MAKDNNKINWLLYACSEKDKKLLSAGVNGSGNEDFITSRDHSYNSSEILSAIISQAYFSSLYSFIHLLLVSGGKTCPPAFGKLFDITFL